MLLEIALASFSSSRIKLAVFDEYWNEFRYLFFKSVILFICKLESLLSAGMILMEGIGDDCGNVLESILSDECLGSVFKLSKFSLADEEGICKRLDVVL